MFDIKDYLNLYEEARELNQQKKTSDVKKYNRFIDRLIKVFDSQPLENKELFAFKEIFNQLSIGIRIQDKNNRIVKVNNYYAHLLNKNAEDIEGHLCKHFICPKFCHETDCSFTQILYTQARVKDKFEVTLQGNIKKIFLYEAIPLKNSEGEINLIFETFFDVTELEYTKKELDESEQMYNKILGSISDAVFITDENLNFTFVCPNADYIFKYTPEEIYELGNITKILGNIDTALNTLYSDNEINNLEREIKDAYGKKHVLLINIKKVDINKGKLLYTCRDITERKKTAIALEQSETRLKTFISQSTDGVTIVDNTGRIIEWNKAQEKITGIKKEEVTGKFSWDVQAQNAFYQDFPSEILEDLKKETINAITNSNHKWFKSIFESPIKTKHGEIRYIQNTIFPLRTMEGQFIGSISRDVTKQKESEFLLKENEEKFRTYIESSPIAIFLADENAKYTYVNEAACEMTGYSQMNFKELGIADIVRTDLTGEANELFRELKKTGKVDAELVFQKKDKTCIDIKISATQLTSNHFIAFCMDITHNKKIERELKEYQEELKMLVEQKTREVLLNEERLQIAFRVANEGMWDWNIKTGEVFFSPTYYTMLGYEPNEFSHCFENWKKLLHPDDSLKTLQFIEEHITHKRKKYTLEFRLKTKGGNYLWIRAKGMVVEWDSDGGPVRFVGTHTDIHEEKLIQNALIKNEKKYRDLTEQINDWIWEMNGNGVYTYCSPKVKDILGYEVAEMLGKTPFDFMPDHEAIKINSVFTDIVKKRIPFSELVNINIHKKGHKIYLETSGNPIFSDEGKFSGYRGVDRDITHRIKAEMAIRESEEKFRNLFNSSLDSIAITSFTGEFLDGNQTMLNSLDMQAKDLRKLNYKQFLNDQSKQHYELYLEEILKKGKALFETDVFLNGKMVFYEVNGKMIKYNRKDAILHVARDITERKEMEAKLINTIIETEEKERGRFARDLHDGLGPQLSAIKLYVDALKTDSFTITQKEKMIDNAKEIIDKSIESTKEIANNIMPSLLSNFGMTEALKTFCQDINETGKIHIELETLPNNIKFHKKQEIILYRVITELINNTIKYAKASKIRILISQNDKGKTIDYSDDGIGFDIDKIMTHRPDASGLNNIMSRIRTIQGKIDIKTSKNSGFSAKISF